MKINKLSEDQWSQIYAIRDEWYRYGTSTESADRAMAETSIADLYKEIGRTVPEFIWVSSPRAAITTIQLIKHDDKITRLSETSRVSKNTIRMIVTSSLESNSSDVPDYATSLVREIRKDSYSTLRQSWWGQHEASWIAFYEAVRRIGIVTYDYNSSRLLDVWASISRSCCWWWPYDTVCVVSDRPEKLMMEITPGSDLTRLHCANGPSLRFRDGYEMYSWHGVRVPRDLIMGKWTINDILREENAEVRRCAIERYGWDSFISDNRFVQVGTSMSDPGNPGQTLSLYDIPEQIYEEPVRLLICTNATPERDGSRRKFGLTVPANINDPISAVAWTFDLTAEEYQTMQRAC